MKIIARHKSLVIIQDRNNDYWLTKRKKKSKTNRRQKMSPRSVRYEPILKLNNMGQIPTAQEFIKQNVPLTCIVLPEWLIEFAKLHVRAALEDASEEASAEYQKEGIDKNSILNAYPLEKIK